MRFDDISPQYIILFPEDLKQDDIEWFWGVGVNMDDFDRIVIADVGTITEVEEEKNMYGYDDDSQKRYEQTMWELSKLAEGCYSSKWYMVEFDDGEVKAVGVAYHS